MYLLFVMMLVLSGPGAMATEPVFYHALDSASLDSSGAKPCDDFYAYACGGWLKSSPAPRNYAHFERGWTAISYKRNAILREILERYGKGDYRPKIKEAREIGRFYSVCLNENLAEKSLPDLKKEFDAIDSIADMRGLSAKVADLRLKGVRGFLSLYSNPDYLDATRTIAEIDSSGVALPDPVYYQPKTADDTAVLKDYRKHIETMFVLAGVPAKQAASDADAALKIETDLASITLASRDKRDPQKTYHPISRTELEKRVKPEGFQWSPFFQTMFEGMSLAVVDRVNLADPIFFEKLDEVIFKKHSLSDLKVYLRWELLSAHAHHLTPAISTEDFKFFDARLSGQREMDPRWETCVRYTNAKFGDAIGVAFLKETHFDEAKKRSVSKILDRLSESLASVLKKDSWMDAPTREAARKKLEQILPRVGFPEKPRSYAGIHVDPKSYFKSALSAETFNRRIDLARITRPTDRAEWMTTAQTANAFYWSGTNTITLAAAALQPPFFEASAPSSANYGAIGYVIGHEITHAFDDNGAQYDGIGNRANWWSAESKSNFEKKQACIQKQFSSYTVGVKNDVHLDGALETGENLADLGGLKLAYEAYQALKAPAPRQRRIAGLNDEQEFFLSFAQMWCTVASPEDEVVWAKAEPHAPSRFRVNGVLRNMPEFAKVFGCKTGDAMAPADRCGLW